MIKILEKDYAYQNVTGEIFHFKEKETDALSIFWAHIDLLLTIEKNV